MVCVQVIKYTQEQIYRDRRNIPRKSTMIMIRKCAGFQLDVIELKKEGLTKVIDISQYKIKRKRDFISR